jgi:lysophospholipase L1-like esterase
MKCRIWMLIASALVVLSACGGGDKEPTTTPSIHANQDNASPLKFAQVATRSRISGNRSGAVFQLMSRSYHHARDDITSLKIAIPNWYIRSGVESGIGGTAKVRASIEFPEGKILGKFKFSDAETGTVQDLQTVLSDKLTFTTPIPNGAKFFIRIYYTNPAGIPYVYTDSVGADQNGGDAANYGVNGIDDLTGSGDPVFNLQPSVGFYPVAIISQTSIKAVAIAGDSKAAGKGDSPSDGTGFGGGLERAIGPSMPFINVANAGASANALSAPTGYLRRQLISFVDTVVFDAGINDVTGSTPALTIFDFIVKARLSVQDKAFYACTQSPSTTGEFTSTSSQSVTANENIRHDLNSILTSPLQTTLSGVFDINAINESQTAPGKWNAGTTSDGVHPNQLGHLNIARSGVIHFP